jgi:phosphatidylserine/phosphatidylglycerophosphate/cardiolipin synthase-like enzyme
MERTKWSVTFQEIYTTRRFFNRFLSSLTDEIDTLTICSPFFNKLPGPFPDVVQFCRFLQKRGDASIGIITRPPGADKSSMTVDVAKTLDGMGVELFIRPSPYLHAKFYHFEYSKGYFRSFIGSANFTLGGLQKNHEVVAELEGVGEASPCQRELAVMKGPGALSFPLWNLHNRPSGDQEAA